MSVGVTLLELPLAIGDMGDRQRDPDRSPLLVARQNTGSVVVVGSRGPRVGLRSGVTGGRRVLGCPVILLGPTGLISSGHVRLRWCPLQR